LQTPVDNAALTLLNTIRGSIHGTVVNQNGAPVVGLPVQLFGGSTPSSTVTDGIGHFHFEDLIPGNYAVVVNGVPTLVTVSSGEEEVGQNGQADLDPGQYENQNPQLNLSVFVADMIAPKVASVKLNSTFWTQTYRDAIDVDTAGAGTGVGYKIPNGANQAQAVAWSNVNRVIIKFTEDVRGSGPGGTLVPADFALLGVNQLSYTITSIAYDATNFRATLTIASVLPLDKYALGADDGTIRDLAGNALDGEWMNNVTMGNSGDGTAGGLFNFHFNVSPGNYNLGTNGGVDMIDMSIMAASFGKSIGQVGYNKFADGNGSGGVDLIDMSIFASAIGKMLPPGTPGVPGFASSQGGGEGESFSFAAATGTFEPGTSALDAAYASDKDDDEDDFPVLSGGGESPQTLDEALSELYSD
jgi:hypothetical protein